MCKLVSFWITILFALVPSFSFAVFESEQFPSCVVKGFDAQNVDVSCKGYPTELKVPKSRLTRRHEASLHEGSVVTVELKEDDYKKFSTRRKVNLDDWKGRREISKIR